MTGPRADQPLLRPATARPRFDRPEDVPPPTAAELDAVERQLATLPRFSGASVAEAPDADSILVSLPGRGPAQNFAACMRWSEAESTARLAVVVARSGGDREWPALMVAEGVSLPASLPARLAAQGWMELEAERVMWTRRPPVVPHLDPQTRLEGATRRSAAEYESLERVVFGLPEARSRERMEGLIAAVDGGELRAFLVRLHGAPVAVARVALAESVAGIYAVGVAPDRRRMGFGALITAIATRSALATGNRLAWLSVAESNEAAMQLYRSLGYQPTFRWSRWLTPPG